MNTVVLLFVCILSDGSYLYQNMPCLDAPSWILDGHKIISQHTRSIITDNDQMVQASAKHEMAKEVARGDAASARAREEINASEINRRELAEIRERSIWLKDAAAALKQHKKY